MNLISTFTHHTVRVTYAALTGTSTYIYHHLRHISVFLQQGAGGVPQETRPFQTNPNEWSGPRANIQGSSLANLAPCEFPVQQGDCEIWP